MYQVVHENLCLKSILVETFLGETHKFFIKHDNLELVESIIVTIKNVLPILCSKTFVCKVGCLFHYFLFILYSGLWSQGKKKKKLNN
jgi:hypothetical protein